MSSGNTSRSIRSRSRTSSFFGGKMGEFMGSVGAVSTADPKRDETLIGALLTDSHPVIIFPEGQMIKDKKLVEKGKYMVYNTGIRRPPHTGAARIALLSQFIREKIGVFRERDDTEKIAAFAERYGFGMDDVDSIIKKKTFIVPVNLTYYPIRARDNAINKLIARFVKNMDEPGSRKSWRSRAPWSWRVSISTSTSARRSRPGSISIRTGRYGTCWPTTAGYLDRSELKGPEVLPPPGHQVHAGLHGLDIRHDHREPRPSLLLPAHAVPLQPHSENDFKNRAFLAIEKLRASGITNIHTSLVQKQFYLLTDDRHDKYDAFIQAASARGLISLNNGVITKNRRLFTQIYDFHTIRKDNIIEVMKNEIEPLEALTGELNRIMRQPPFWIRRNIRRHFIRLDRELFERDYGEYYIAGESKPKEIGRPFYLKHFFPRRGFIMVHGYMAAPEEIRPLADFIYRNGYSVYGARLRGHGTAPEDLAGRNWEKWYDSVSRAYIIMKNSVRSFAIGGFSTGAGIALLQSANKPGRFRGVVSINAPLRLQNISSKFSSAVVMWNKLLSTINVNKGRMEFVTNKPENEHINYFRNPVAGVSELGKLMKVVEDRLKLVSDPALIVQGSDDPVVNPVSGLEIFAQLGTERKQLVRIYAKHHGILRGKEASDVQARVLEFLDGVFSR